MRHAEADKPGAEDQGRDGDHAHEPAHAFARRQREGREERAHAAGAHQEAECVRAAMQHPRGEDGHEHREGHAHQADSANRVRIMRMGRKPVT